MRTAGSDAIQFSVSPIRPESSCGFHQSDTFVSPGSTVGQITTAESLKLVAECLNRAHKATTSVITVIENMVQ